MRLTTRTNLAMRTLMVCAMNPGRQVRSAEIAALCNASAHHVAHVVQALHAEGYVAAQRGRSGGLQLAQPPERISVGAVVRLFEQDIPFAECFGRDGGSCPLLPACRLRGYLQRALEAFYHELDKATLDDLVRGNVALGDLVGLPEAAP
jgi:Rrf2 family protein